MEDTEAVRDFSMMQLGDTSINIMVIIKSYQSVVQTKVVKIIIDGI